MPEKIEIENVNIPGRTERVDRTKYTAMRKALLAALPHTAPGMTVAEAQAALLPFLSETDFPERQKAGWWMKAVQLDLEAKGLIRRAPHKPVHLYRIAPATAD
ncbi:hypothetical protein KYK30_07405 [Shinella yambaruensis]|uniref:DUF3489 domain-containing protein n=1 Tax=Shinella yambaruensis TaxID=415996 RepID=A0ABQ5ZUY2_9HYPH|nr:hypothetical protein [Shinella yambaruensis]MCJ8025058.1 hypothetical protein [Shinella yambaruensis]MCU7979511.1 hypothetical protein [Shinella yambaruensis]GLR54393.1 hypothetical protein GCM10007923_56100 [Shinella yambaruensis]